MVGEGGYPGFSFGFGSDFGLDIFVMYVILLIFNLISMEIAHESSVDSADIPEENKDMFRRLRAGERPDARYERMSREREARRRNENPVKAMKRRVRF